MRERRGGGLRDLQWTETKISFSSNVVNNFTESSIYGSLAILDDYVPAQNCKRWLEKILISNSVVNCLLHCFDLSSMILKSRWYTSKPTRISIQRNSIFAWLDVVFTRTVNQSTPQNYRNKATFWNFSKPVDMPWSTSVRQVVRLLIESAVGSTELVKNHKVYIFISPTTNKAAPSTVRLHPIGVFLALSFVSPLFTLYGVVHILAIYEY